MKKRVTLVLVVAMLMFAVTGIAKEKCMQVCIPVDSNNDGKVDYYECHTECTGSDLVIIENGDKISDPVDLSAIDAVQELVTNGGDDGLIEESNPQPTPRPLHNLLQIIRNNKF